MSDYRHVAKGYETAAIEARIEAGRWGTRWMVERARVGEASPECTKCQGAAEALTLFADDMDRKAQEFIDLARKEPA